MTGDPRGFLDHGPGRTRPMPRASAKKITIDYICEDLGISRSTFYDWRAKGRAPKCTKLPNGALRVYLTDYENWLADREDAA
ncbi:helix-turn-helix transcriptional regulator [Streptosporangium sp. NPDC001559]|uniref:helix-turn-helix transcriptional regulator n=1 Tax=Streptosporangium sp. NPDC001559 TaxID=3366187 RepID=UPI0036E2FE2E